MTRKLDAFEQFHIIRKLGPVVCALDEVRTLFAGANVMDVSISTAAAAMKPIAYMLAEMPEADCNFVLQKGLSVCERQIDSNHWQRLWNASAGQMQFSDIDWPDMLQIVYKVFEEVGLLNFTNVLGQSSAEPRTEANTPPNT